MDTTPTFGARRVARAGAAGVAALAALTAGLAVAGPAGAASRATSASVASDTLTVTSGQAADRLALRLAPGDATRLQVDVGDDGTPEHTFDRATFSRIVVDSGAGDDSLRIDQANGAFADEAITVFAGSGDDTFSGGDGAEVYVGGSGRDSADPNRGDDTGIMGSGRDTFRWDPGDGSDHVEGQAGFDTLDFNGAGADENMKLVPNGERTLFLRDVANIRMDMDDVERLDLTALGGADTMLVGDMTGTDFRRADIDLSGPAGGGDGSLDAVTVTGSDARDAVKVRADGTRVDVTGLRVADHISGAEPTDKLQVNTGDGKDRVNVDPAAQALIQVGIDLGADQF